MNDWIFQFTRKSVIQTFNWTYPITEILWSQTENEIGRGETGKYYDYTSQHEHTRRFPQIVLITSAQFEQQERDTDYN